MIYVNKKQWIGVKITKTWPFVTVCYIYIYMQRRKLQATGGSSLTLTLPKAWTSQFRLQSKDEVIVSPSGPVLSIKPASKTKQDMTVEVTIDDMPELWVVREMIGAFIAGADRITLRSRRISPAQNQAIREAVQLLFGFEIVEETSQKISARNVLDESKFSVSESTLRIFMIARSMFEDALKAAQSGDKELATDIKQRDYEVNKFLHAIKRQFQETLIGKIDNDPNEVSFYRSVAIQLERIADHAVKIADLASAGRVDPVKLSSTFPVIQAGIHELLKDVESMVRHLDKRQAHQVLDSGKKLERLVYASQHMKQFYEGAIIEDSLDRLRGYLMNIAEMTIDYALITSDRKG